MPPAVHLTLQSFNTLHVLRVWQLCSGSQRLELLHLHLNLLRLHPVLLGQALHGVDECTVLLGEFLHGADEVGNHHMQIQRLHVLHRLEHLGTLAGLLPVIRLGLGLFACQLDSVSDALLLAGPQPQPAVPGTVQYSTRYRPILYNTRYSTVLYHCTADTDYCKDCVTKPQGELFSLTKPFLKTLTYMSCIGPL